MLAFILQSVVPFVFSALIVIIITVIAEKYGTKVGGIFGTLPSTIIIAFIFIALNKGVGFASKSVAVVPSEMGINLLFLLIFVTLAYRSTTIALICSMTVWAILSSVLYLLNISDILLSFVIYYITSLHLLVSGVCKKSSFNRDGNRSLYTNEDHYARNACRSYYRNFSSSFKHVCCSKWNIFSISCNYFFDNDNICTRTWA